MWNSTFQTRYIVLPERPASTEQMTRAELTALVMRDAMVGVARVEPEKKQSPGLSRRHVSNMPGPAALPRRSGELQFQDPWESIAFAMAVALCERGVYVWAEFQERLIAEIVSADRQPPETRPGYYESWLAAFEKLLDARNILARTALNHRVRQIKRGLSLRGAPLPFGARPWPDDEG